MCHPRMRPGLLVLLLSLVAGSLAGCGAGGAGGSADGLPPDDQFRPEITHTYFPLQRGSVRTYLGEHEGAVRREEETTLRETKRARRIECTGIRQDVYDDDLLVETTTEWYAQDAEGNVWKFGEESLVLEGRTFVRTEDSWIAGQADVVPFIAFPAAPRPGDVYVVRHRAGTDRFVVEALDAVAEVPAGTFPDCLQVHENPDDAEDSDIILYAPGLGRVAETSTGGFVELATYATAP